MRVFIVKIFVYLAMIGFAAAGALAADQPRIAPPDAWVKQVSIPKPDPKKLNASHQFLLTDSQDFFGPDSTDNFIETAALFQTAEGLSGGGIAIPWHPGTSALIIHHVTIIRGKEKIDILANQSFSTLQREPNLEIAMLDGVMTAVLQPEGLRVGDILSFAWTVRHSNPVFQKRANQITPYITSAAVNEFRLRQVWPHSRAMRWQASPDLPRPTIRKTKTGTELSLTLKNAKPPTTPRGAPAYLGVTATLETTDFKSWSEISTLFAPLFRKAARIKPGSPLDAEAKKIAAQTDDKTMRAELALKLVQEQIRYVFVGFESGGYVPVSAEQTWARRFGDCKAKTSVLVALLHALHIKAEPALVSSMLGGGLGDRLPVIGLFDHVIVRTEIEGEEYWLDGTRIGDVSLERISSPAYYWALPLRDAGAELTEVLFKAPEEPTFYVEMNVDASKGLSKPAPVTTRMVMRGDSAINFRSGLNSLSESQKEHQLKNLWRRAGLGKITTSDMVYSDMSWDEQTGDLSFSMTGVFEIASELFNHRLYYWVPNGGFQWSAAAFDDGNEDRAAPWVLPYPFFEHAITAIILPDNGDDLSLDGESFSVAHAGFEMMRNSEITDGLLTMERTAKITQPELSVADARALTAQLSYHQVQQVSISKPNPASLATISENTVETAGDHIERGLFLLSDGQFEMAYGDFSRAIELKPGSSQGYANRGRASYHLLNYESARQDFEKALSINEENMTALIGVGRLLVDKFKHELALDYFDRAIDANPENNDARKDRARAYLSLARYEDALADLDIALEIRHDDSEIFWLKSRILSAMSKWEKAVVAVTEALTLAPNNTTNLSMRAWLYSKLGKTDLALADYDRAIALIPHSVSDLNSRCWVRASHKVDLEKALADCNLVNKLSPDVATFIGTRALVYLQMQEFEMAIADYDDAIELHPNQVASFYGRGIAKLQLGDKGGQADIDAAIALDDGIAKTFEEYGVTPQ